MFHFSALLCSASLVLAMPALPALAEVGDPDQFLGDWAGTYICSAGEQGITLSIDEAMQVEGAGDTTSLSGVLNFYSTVANPDRPEGAFTITGSVVGDTETGVLELAPGDWLDEPENWGASGIEGIFLNGRIEGEPTASGCHVLGLRKLVTR